MKVRYKSVSFFSLLLFFFCAISIVYGQEIPAREFSLDSSTVYTALSPDASMILAGSEGVQVLNALTGDVMKEFESSSQITAVAFSPGNSKVAACSLDGKVTVWDISTGNILHQFDFEFQSEEYTFESGSIALQISSNEKYLLVGPGSSYALESLNVWDLENQTSVYQTTSSNIGDCALFSGTKLFYKWTFRGNVYDLLTLEELHSFPYGYVPSPDGQEMVCFSIGFYEPEDEYHYRIMDMETEEQLREHHIWTSGGDLRAIFSPSGKYILLNVDKELTIYDYETWTPLRYFPSGAIIPQAFSADDRWLLTQEENVLKIWDISDIQSGVDGALCDYQ